MKKSFPLEVPNHQPPRVIEGIKADVRKYLKRERRKPLPEEVDFWDFDCRAGKDADSATEVHVSEILAPIDQAARESWDAVYIEILAKPGRRSKPVVESEIPEEDFDPENAISEPEIPLDKEDE